jgi:hypothetical protein
MKKLLSLTLLGFLTACFPSVVYNPIDGGKAFTMTIDGQNYTSQNGTFVAKYQDFEIQFVIFRNHIGFTLVNTSDKVIKVIWDDSVMILPNGKTTRAIPSFSSYADRNSPKAPSIAPPKSKIEDGFYPLDNAYFDSYVGYYYRNIFEYPLKSETNIRLSVALLDGDTPIRIDALFSGKPNQ